MGLLVNGAWQEDISRTKEGRFIRPAAALRNFVTRDGSAGPSGEGGFPAEAGRYHLYVSLACPWAHRTLIFRALKKLEPIISASITEPLYGKTGWEFGIARGGTLDTVNGKATLAEIYLLADPHYTGRVSVPVLWDKKRRTIVNNESSEIIRMLNIPTSTTACIAPVLRPASKLMKKPPALFSRHSTRSRSAWRANAT